MFCPNCGKTVPDGAKFCGSCGHALMDAAALNTEAQQPPKPAQPEPPVRQSFFPQDDAASANGAGQGSDTIRQTIDRSFEEQPGQDWNSGYSAPPEPPKPPKKKKGLLIGGIIAAVVIIAAVAVALNFKFVSNAVMRSFASPESYYRHVEKQSMGDVIDSGTSIYDNTLMDNLAADQRTVTSDTTITVGEPVRELVESLTGQDMDWLETVNLNEIITLEDGKLGVNLDASLNGVAIATAEIVTDEGDIYFRVPEIRDDYALIDQRTMAMQGVNMGTQSALTTLLQDSSDLLPESDRLSKVLNRYVEVIVDNIEDVEKGSDTLEAGSVSQKYTTLSIHLEGDDLARIIEALCTTALEDDDLKEILGAAAETAGSDPDDVWEELVDELEYAMDNADRIADRVELDMTVYVDGKGDIRGRTVVINDYMKLEYAAPEDGSKYGIRLAVSQDDYEQFVFEGDGKNKEGSFEMAVEGLHILDVSATDFDRDDLKNGYLNGSFDISLSSFVSNQLGSELDIGGLRGLDLRDIHLLLDSSASKDKSNIALRLMLGDEEYLAVTLDTKASGGGKVDVPADSMSAESWVQKINATNLDSILDHLEDAGVPDNLLRMLFYGR